MSNREFFWSLAWGSLVVAAAVGGYLWAGMLGGIIGAIAGAIVPPLVVEAVRSS